MGDKELISSLSDYLFWDVQKESVDSEKNAPYIVCRVLEYGQLSDWDVLVKKYGLDEIVRIAKGLRSLDPKSLSFISTISNTPRESFRCFTTKQSSPEHWIY